MSIKAKLNAVLEALGKPYNVNLQEPMEKALDVVAQLRATAPEKSQDPLDGAAHEYNVAAFIASYGDARKKKAKDGLVRALGEQGASLLRSTKDGVADSEISENVELGVSKFHSVTAQVKIGASYLDIDGLRVELMKKMNSLEVDALFERHMRRRDPSVTYIIGETRE